jgi:hypothetical protein
MIGAFALQPLLATLGALAAGHGMLAAGAFALQDAALN